MKGKEPGDEVDIEKEKPCLPNAQLKSLMTFFSLSFSLDGSFRYLFWSLFQDIDTDVFKTDRRFDKYGIIQYTGEIMIALYCVVAIVVALNLLIAMLTNTFNKVGVS